MNKTHIRMIFTGGTISMKIDPLTGGAVPALSGDDILHAMRLEEEAIVSVVEYGKFPGPHITPTMMLEIARLSQEAANDPTIDGVIITHGTDTLEETAYFLDLALTTEKPVIVIGSMYHSDDPLWDGPTNVRDAVMAIASGQFKGLGVLTCLHGEINAASEVTKTHTQQRDTFMSFDFGPLGRIFEDQPVFLRKPYLHEHIGLVAPVEPVHILKCYAGMDIIPYQTCVEHHIRGLVVEAMGTGNVPPRAFDGILEVLASGIPVVLVSRCPRGRTEDVYGYYGAGKQLHGAGVLFARYLNGQKARIKLMMCLGAGMSEEALRQAFDFGG